MASATVKPAKRAPEAQAFEFDNERHIVIAQKVYEREHLGEQVRAVISHINHADQEIATAEANVRVYKLGRDRMVQELIERLEAEQVAPVALVPDAQDGTDGD